MERQVLQNSINDYEQRTFIKFGVLLGYSAADILRLLKTALGPRSYKQRTVYDWVRNIKEGRTDVSEARGGPHRTHSKRKERVEEIKEKLAEHRGWSLRELAHETGIPRSIVGEIIKKNLEMRKLMNQWVPHSLTEEVIETRIMASRNNLLRYRRHPRLLKRTIAIDESWVGLYTQPKGDKRRSWVSVGEKRQKMVRENIRDRKRMLIMAMDFNGIAFWELLPEKSTVNSQVYQSFLERNIPNWMRANNFQKAILAQDNARPHIARSVMGFLERKGIETWVQPPYSPDLQPCDFNCFGELKRQLSGNSYTNWAELENSINDILTNGVNWGLFMGVRKLPDRWERVVQANGEYLS